MYSKVLVIALASWLVLLVGVSGQEASVVEVRRAVVPLEKLGEDVRASKIAKWDRSPEGEFEMRLSHVILEVLDFGSWTWRITDHRGEALRWKPAFMSHYNARKSVLKELEWMAKGL